ncbi:MAG: hypothetical protein ACQEWV_26155 [Bacillota bacterium]
MKKIALLMSVIIIGIMLASCNGNGEQFDPEVEKKEATEVMNGVLTSFGDLEKLAEAKTSDEANILAWEKLKEKNTKAISNDLSEEDQKRLLYLLTINKAEDLDNGETKANLLFSHDTEVKNVSLNETEKTFTYDIERSGFDHTLITLEKQQDEWKVTKVKNAQ